MDKPLKNKNFPILITLEAGPFAWCTCGRSSKLPFCDGTHKGNRFTLVAFKKPEKRKKWLCVNETRNNKIKSKIFYGARVIEEPDLKMNDSI